MILDKKVVIIIGGGGLIGRELVKDAVRKGATVINCDIAFDTDWEKGTYHLDVTSTERPVGRRCRGEVWAHRRAREQRLSPDQGLGMLL